MDATEQVTKFKEFFETLFYRPLLEAVNRGDKHLSLDFAELSKYSVELAEDLLEDPENTLQAAKHTIEQMDLGGDTKGFEVRFSDLPETSHLMVRNVRSKHIGKFIQMEGIVRQKSDVRPQVTSARFECPSCGNIIPILQLDQKFKEPQMCACGRKGQFRLIHKELVDAQKIVLEESPDDMEGGEQPKRLDMFLRNDLVSPITDKKTNPGSKVKVTGLVKEVPITLATGGKSTRFDLIYECNYVEPVQEEFTNLVFTEEEVEKIRDLAQKPDAFSRLTTSLAPTIYGHERIKEALLLQLFSGLRKTNDDGVSRRGDIHILLIGDPGSGKCVRGDTKVCLGDGTITTMESLAEEHGLDQEQQPITPIDVPSLQLNGAMGGQSAVRVWKREEEELLKLTLASGKTLHITRNHPLFHHSNGHIVAKQAEDFAPGERIATPRKLSIEGALQTFEEEPILAYNNHGKRYTFPQTLDAGFARIMGYWCGDGHLNRTPTSAWISFTNSEEEVLEDYRQLFTACFGQEPTRRYPHAKKSASEYYVTARRLYDKLHHYFPEVCTGSQRKSIPELVTRSPDGILAEFIKALFECDGHVNKSKRQVEFSTISRELAETLQLALLRFGVVSSRKEKSKHATNTEAKRKVKAYDLIISGEFAAAYADKIGFVSARKREALESIRHDALNTNVDLVPDVAGLLFFVRKSLGLTQKDMGVPRPTYAHYEQQNRLPSTSTLRRIARHVSRMAPDDPAVLLLNQLAFADIHWDRILSTEPVPHGGSVYDFEVEETHNFVADGVIVHNSQLVKRMGVVAPKARFVSGKGASGAGLTAAVVKDEFLKGWALEAGALVLANKGLAAIDEMDKMNDEDTSAMHEALEQQSITISKANIQATLKCETTVLAAANPKFGRFDPYELIAKQIDLPSTLINRFDLIFPIKDMPDLQRDDKMASFILNLHRKGHSSLGDNEDYLDTEFVRKYIAYARQHVKPDLTDDALDEIKRYYVQMRNQGGNSEGQTSAIPISARQLEALVRLAEASAKSRLSDKVTRADAKRSIELVHYCLSQIGLDPETGKMDIDRITTGITASQRSNIGIIKDVISELEKAIGKMIPADDIVREAEIKGVAQEKTNEVLERLKRSGDLFSPKNGFISKI